MRWLAWAIVLICGFIIWYTYNNLQSELAPMEDRNSVRFSMTAPEGTSYDKMQDISDKVVDYLYDSVPERDFVFAATPGFSGTGSNSGFGRVGLIPAQDRVRSQNEIAQAITKNCRSLTTQEYLPYRNKRYLWELVQRCFARSIHFAEP